MPPIPFYEYMQKMGCKSEEVSRALEPYIHGNKNSFSKDAAFNLMFETDAERTRRHKSFEIAEVVAAHHLSNMKTVLMHSELARWRTLHGFDRSKPVVRDDILFSPQEYTAYMLSEVDELRDAIFLSPSERRRKRMERFARELQQGKVNMELTDAEHESIKEYLEKRSRDEAVQAEVNATPVQIFVQICTTYASNPVPPQDACIILEDGEQEVRVDLGLEQELEPSSADTDTETSVQQYSPSEGTKDHEQITASGFLQVGVVSSQGGKESPPQENMDNASPPEHVCTQVGKVPDETNVTSEESKTYDPGGQEKDLLPCKSSLYKPSFFFIWGELGASSTCVLFLLSYVFGFSFSCVSLFFPNSFFHR